MDVPEFINDLCSGIAFWEALYEEERKNNEALCRDCTQHVRQLERDFDELIQKHPDWLHLNPDTEKLFKNNLKQQELLSALLDRFVIYEQVTRRLAQAYLTHSVAQAEVGDERLTWLTEAIHQRDFTIADLKKTLHCFKECYTGLLRNYNDLTELLLTKHKPPEKL